ncbi:MAG: DUF1501 domain-containing protein [Gammaproteobacteria bacterium]
MLVFLRGGCDGLNTVVPYRDDAYYIARPRIALSRPRANASDVAIDLDGFFGLHPALAPMRVIYGQGRLALLPAVHFPVTTRSHFHAQSIVERASGMAVDGWLNRYLKMNSNLRNGLAISNQVPEALRGALPAPAYADPLDRRLAPSEVVDGLLARVLEESYKKGGDDTGPAFASWRSAGLELDASRSQILSLGATSSSYPGSALGRDLAAAATLLRNDPNLSVIMVADGGWDTHSHQGGATGRQATQLANLAAALAAFDADLGSRRDDVAVLVQTEFGRTLRENASGGTDHGGASAWMVISSTLRGGIHLGTRGWPGLDEGSLLDGRALAPAVDFRDVYADLLRGHLGCPDVDAVLPDRPGLVTGLI